MSRRMACAAALAVIGLARAAFAADPVVLQLRGPSQFGLNMAVTRSFPWKGGRTWDWRLDATNVLNHLTYTSINSYVGTPQFGLPNNTVSPRKIQTSLRLRF